MAEIRNPNQQGGGSGSNSSFIVMMVVMLGVLLGMQYFRSKHTTPLENSTAQQTAKSAAQQPAPATQPAASTATASGATPASAPGSSGKKTAAAPATPAITATAETTTVIDSELYRIEFTNKGAAVKSWILKKHKGNDGKPLDLVNHGLAQEFGLPLTLWTYDTSLTHQINDAMYVASATGNLSAPQTVTFRYNANGLDITKTFSFGTGYEVKADFIARRDGAPVRALLAWPSGFGDQDQQVSYNGFQIEKMSGGKAEHIAYSKVSNGNTINAPFDYAGVAGQFFAAIFVPEHPQTATAVTLHGQADLEKLKDKNSKAKPVNIPVIGAAAGDISGHSILSVYVGPKSYTVMKATSTPGGENLSSVVDFGFFGPIAKGLFFALHFLQQHGIPNWGWAIVVFTIIINIILLPLRYASMKSAIKMQRLQPQMDAIKARYAKYKVTDPKRSEMNQEIMQLQKDNGVNMFAGCVPSLIQMPLLFAMFTMLERVVEMRDAHWFWLHNLTAADPYHILPIFMVVSQFLVQFYMPSPGVDPQQQKMMAFMLPAFSGYMTWNYSSGLALYWCVGNVIMIIQQYVMNQSSLGKEMKAIAAKRARKQKTKVIQGKR
ncbi:MAG: membrane protein insertase YidC [Acidobacteria bacterium]|nr:membrane protein insertase YidC [Acidobacteriota bacterium]